MSQPEVPPSPVPSPMPSPLPLKRCVTEIYEKSDEENSVNEMEDDDDEEVDNNLLDAIYQRLEDLEDWVKLHQTQIEALMKESNIGKVSL